MAEGNPNITPYYIMVVRHISVAKQAFLVLDKTITSEIPIDCTIAFVLLAAFFVFNICHPKGCANLFSFLETITFNYPASKPSATLKHF